MSSLSQIFGNYHNTNIRWNGDPTNPIWVAADIGKVLKIKNTRDLLRNFDEDEKGVVAIYTPGGLQHLAGVTEPGLYRIVFQSRKEAAKSFRRWVFHEVLPKLRKTGEYSLNNGDEQQPKQLDPQTKLQYTDKIMEVSTNFAEVQPRLAQELTDLLMNEMKGEQPVLESGPRYRGIVEIAEDMGYQQAKKMEVRSKLGNFASSKIKHLSRKETRFCNGQDRKIREFFRGSRISRIKKSWSECHYF
ncbi:MAG: Bro-N domain-containing protein [Candidatus Bipolaricaulia bacterium]